MVWFFFFFKSEMNFDVDDNDDNDGDEGDNNDGDDNGNEAR